MISTQVRAAEKMNDMERVRNLAVVFQKAITDLMEISPEETYHVFDDPEHVPSIYHLGDLTSSEAKKQAPDKVRMVLCIVYLLNAIPSESALAIWKSFFLRAEDDWWKKRYSKSGYYRLRKKALQEFFSIADAN